LTATRGTQGRRSKISKKGVGPEGDHVQCRIKGGTSYPSKRGKKELKMKGLAEKKLGRQKNAGYIWKWENSVPGENASTNVSGKKDTGFLGGLKQKLSARK